MQSAARILDGELLRAFFAFATELNFTRAARRCALSQPALFERVRKLSDQLGVALYVRDGRALALTAEGARVAAFAREWLDRSAKFSLELRGESTRESVTIASGEGAYLYLLGPTLARLGADEALQLELLTLGGPSAVSAVLEGRAHVGVGVVDMPPRGLVAKDALKTPMCAVMSRAHPLAKKSRVTLRELGEARLILPPEGQSHRSFIARAIEGAGSTVAPPIEADGWPLALHFAAMGLGVAVANATCAVPRGAVARPIPELGAVMYRVFHRRGALEGAVQRVAEVICEDLRRRGRGE
jgi:DNA-binding transcriptional LysR family regulator